MIDATALQRARAAGDPGALLARIPYGRFLGVEAALVDGAVVTTLRYGDHLVGNPALPALHGGTLGALLELTAVLTVAWSPDVAALPRPVTITVDYLRSARPVDTRARGVITRHGRRVANVRVDAWQDDPAQPVASAHAHLLLARDAPG